MMYWVLFGIITFIFLATSVLIYFRSKSVYIVRRSPLLMGFSLWGNYFESISILPYFSVMSIENASQFLDRFQDAGIIIGHCLFYFPYVLRSYRLYIVFNLEKDWDKNGAAFTKRIPRTRQIWQVKALFFLLLPALFLSILLITYGNSDQYFPISGRNVNNNDASIATGIYILVSFVEQMVLIFVTYKLRNIEDDYNMKNELISISVIWAISPLFSTFVETNKTVWFSACLLRNFMAYIRSDVVPIVFSFKPTPFAEALTVDMLNSLEIILENEQTLGFFERFLKNEPKSECKDSGYSLLCLFKELECKIYDKIDSHVSFFDSDSSRLNLSSLEKIEKNPNSEGFKKAKSVVFKILNEKYYQNFLRSEECKELRRVINKQEVLAYRVMQTSFVPISKNRQSRGNFIV